MVYNNVIMKNMKTTTKQSILRSAAAFFAIFALIASFSFTSVAHAELDMWDSADYSGYDDYSFDYYDQPDYDYSYDYYDYPDYDYGYSDYDYGYSPSYTPSYSPSYTPSYRPSYSTPSYSPQMPVYIPTQNQNQNQAQSQSQTSTNTNNNNNVNNNVNNVHVVIGSPISGNQTVPQQQSLDGYCVVSPTSVTINQDVRFTANASGGNGNYSYNWSGTDGVYSSSQSFTGRYQTPGSKSVSVTITSGGQSITRSCSVNVDQGYVNNYNNLTAYCVASPTNASVGQNVVWTVYATGGYGYNNGYNSGYGNYTYSWTGSDGLSYGNASAIQKVYTTPGTKTATVTVYSNGQSISANCSTNIIGVGAPVSNVTVIRQPTAGTPVSGVYLSQVPDTGIEFNLKVALFLAGLLIWSAFFGYVMVARKKGKTAFATNASANLSVAERINQFKLENMRKKGLTK